MHSTNNNAIAITDFTRALDCLDRCVEKHVARTHQASREPDSLFNNAPHNGRTLPNERMKLLGFIKSAEEKLNTSVLKPLNAELLRKMGQKVNDLRSNLESLPDYATQLAAAATSNPQQSQDSADNKGEHRVNWFECSFHPLSRHDILATLYGIEAPSTPESEKNVAPVATTEEVIDSSTLPELASLSSTDRSSSGSTQGTH